MIQVKLNCNKLCPSEAAARMTDELEPQRGTRRRSPAAEASAALGVSRPWLGRLPRKTSLAG